MPRPRLSASRTPRVAGMRARPRATDDPTAAAVRPDPDSGAAPASAEPASGSDRAPLPEQRVRPSPRPRRPRPSASIDQPTGEFDPDKVSEELAGRAVARRRLPRRVVYTSVALVAVIVAMIVVVTLLLLDYQQAKARDEAREQAPVKAKQYTATVLSYDYRHIDKDAEAGLRLTTGDYRRQYEQSMHQLVIPKAQQVKAVVQAEVLSAGVSSVNESGDQAVVVVFANQTVTNTQIKGSRVDQVRVRLTMVKDGGDWRISKVDSL